MRATITGISGFVGSHIANALAASGAVVSGIPRDITDADSVRAALAAAKPTHVFHCAGVLKDCGADTLHRTNVTGTEVLLDAVAATAADAVVVIAGSSAVYGNPARLPVMEEDPLEPLSAYGASKVAQEAVATERARANSLRVIRARMFNLVGPRQSALLAFSSIARQIALCERGLADAVRVGNLSSRRDYCDVRDAARAHVLLAERGMPGEVYNICSGVSRSGQEAIEILLNHARTKVRVEVDERRFQANEIEEQRGSFERLHAATGWEPAIDFETSLRDLLEDWRGKVEREGNNA